MFSCFVRLPLSASNRPAPVNPRPGAREDTASPRRVNRANSFFHPRRAIPASVGLRRAVLPLWSAGACSRFALFPPQNHGGGKIWSRIHSFIKFHRQPAHPATPPTHRFLPSTRSVNPSAHLKMSISALKSDNADMLILATQPCMSRKKFGDSKNARM